MNRSDAEYHLVRLTCAGSEALTSELGILVGFLSFACAVNNTQVSDITDKDVEYSVYLHGHIG